MDPISAIAGALIAGASAAATDVASKAVKDAYEALKNLIATKFKRKAAIEMVEEAPESPAAHEALNGALKEAKVDRDPDIAKLAEALTAALQDLGSEKLTRAKIKIGDVDGFRNAIVRNLAASGDVEVGNVTARGGDAVVSDLIAGDATKKNH
jgi:hypothetical protein